jgi:hypothetical protein
MQHVGLLFLATALVGPVAPTGFALPRPAHGPTGFRAFSQVTKTRRKLLSFGRPADSYVNLDESANGS